MPSLMPETSDKIVIIDLFSVFMELSLVEETNINPIIAKKSFKMCS